MAPRRGKSTLPEGYVEDLSKGAMLRFEDSLPKLPVPKLEETAARYYQTLKPLLNEAELAKSKKAIEEFIAPGGRGRKLQEELLALREKPGVKNWIAEWWNDAAYLTYRDPVVPYVSYFYSHRDDRKRRDPAKRAAAITTAALEFRKSVIDGSLEPEYMKGRPISMDSYKYMFNCTRLAAKPKDGVTVFPPNEGKFICVIRKNRFYRVDIEAEGKQLNTAELEAQFKDIYKQAGQKRFPAVGALTTQNRDVLVDNLETLMSAGKENAAARHMIESSAFVVCLDDASPVTLEERAHQYWHGDGQNRWFDKPLQFIINDNGTAGFMGEHSMMDGTPTHRLNDYVNDVIFNNKIDLSSPSIRSLPPPKPFDFTVTSAVQSDIDAAVKAHTELIAKHELAVQSYQGYGKGLIKKFKTSPDAYVQMIIQLAYHKMHGLNRPTYESAATRRFQQGRTETCRSVSEHSAAWCAAMASDTATAEEKIELFRKATAAHVEYITAASDGKGVDRHLFGLKKLLKEGEELPAIYKDPAFAYSGSWFLSTSQLSSEFFNGYGWSQVIDEGFGIAYMINENNINFNIVSKGMGSPRMSFYLSEAASEMRDLLAPTLEAPKSKL